MARVLIVDDDQESRLTLRRLFASMGHGTDEASDGKQAVSKACSFTYELVILDLSLPKLGGIRVLKALKDECPEVAVIVTTGSASVEPAIEAMKVGAYGYVTKPLNVEEVRMVAEQALDRRRLIDQNKHLLGELEERCGLDNLIGASPRAKEAYSVAASVAPTDSAVLILGESGAGKERLARAIHGRSKRAGGPFVKVNCCEASETVLAVELFGQERGVSREAGARQVGHLELAEGGTIFLDEIADVGSRIQSKLLRFLQHRQFGRVGGSEMIRCDARVIASTSRDLAGVVQKKEFRSDLYRHLASAAIALPPLRDRAEDIPAFADHFIAKYAAETGKSVTSIAEAAVAQLVAYEWRGNIRELENCIEKSVILCDGECVQPAHIVLNGATPPLTRRKQGQITSLREIERDHIKRVLAHCNWNRSAAASILEIDRKTLRSKIREFGFTPPPGK